jgi:hypothetical protein
MNYLLTLSSKTPGQNRFIDSLKNINVEHIAVQFQPFNERLDPFTYIHHNFAYPGHIQKYGFVPRDLDKDRYIIFTDTDDVIFQADLPELKADLYLAPENVIHRGSWWEPYINEHPVFESLLDKPIYNSGCWAMKVKTLYELLDFQQKIGIFGNLYQCYFNLFIQERPDLSRVEDLSIFCALHANIHRKDVYKEDVWKFNGKIISCVHANGSLKEYL